MRVNLATRGMKVTDRYHSFTHQVIREGKGRNLEVSLKLQYEFLSLGQPPPLWGYTQRHIGKTIKINMHRLITEAALVTGEDARQHK